MFEASPGALAPRSVTGVVARGLRLWSDNAVTLWGVLVPITFAAEIAGVLATVAAAPAGARVLNGTIYVLPGSSTGGIVAARLFANSLLAVAGIIGTGAALRIFSEDAHGRSEPAREALRFGLRRFGSLLWLGIISFVLIAAASIALIIPGIYVLVAFFVAFPVLVVEGLTGGAALRRSHQLVKGRWWATLGALLPSAILVGAGGVLIATTLRVSGSVLGLALAQALGGLVIQALLVPLATASSVAIYLDLRARKEPGSIEASTPAPPPLTGSAASPATGDIWS